jgi:hypothetical protein
VKVTDTPLAADPLEVTVATNGALNAAPTVALCGVPLVAVMAIVGGLVGGTVVELEPPPQATRAAIMVRPSRREIDFEKVFVVRVIVHLRVLQLAMSLRLPRAAGWSC